MTGAYPELFNDVFGPVMQPGSSSHTAAPCRLGRLAADLLGEPPLHATVELADQGSFAGTFGIMAEDRAMVAGILGMTPDDERLFDAFELAAAAGLTVEFAFVPIPESDHPNALRFLLSGRERTVSLLGTSTGGGMIEVLAVDGFDLRTRGDAYVLLAADHGGELDEAAWAELTGGLPALLDASAANDPRRGGLFAVTLAEPPDLQGMRATVAARAPSAHVALLRPVLPVVSLPHRKPQLFDTMTRWRELAGERDVPLWEVMLDYEALASAWTRDRILDELWRLMRLMHRQTRAVYENDHVVPSSPFKPDFAGRWAQHQAAGPVSDPLTAATIRWAYGAGAGIPGVVTVPGPMGGGGGYVYAALRAVRDARRLGDEDVLHGLLVAGGVGVIAFSRTEPTGEVIGCTGEAGVCGAMAAAGIAAMAGGSPAHVESAASLALQAFTGMPCDPMPGGLCQPCRSRIMAATVSAHVFADLALAGHDAVLPLHEALDVADRIGRALPPELLCTSAGGACGAPSALARREAYERWFAASAPRARPPGNLI
jgi:L-serine dehydratase